MIRSRYTVGPVLVGRRHVSSTVAFTVVDRITNKQAKLRVPLLKSPTHLGHFTSRVNRLYNEDKYSANVLELPENRTVFNFNMFDGHGGDQCSTYLSEKLSQHIEDGTVYTADPKDKNKNELLTTYWKTIGGYWKRWYKHRKDNFKQMEKECKAVKLANIKLAKDDLPLRLPLSFLKADYTFFEREDNKLGSCCTAAFIETIHDDLKPVTKTKSRSKKKPEPVSGELYYFNRGTISKLTIAHVGDTRAILVDKDGMAHPLTRSHHPSNPVEASRLRKYTANFFMTDSFGEERFISLANTRAFGDVAFKQMGVTAEPEILQLIIGDRDTIHKKLSADEIKNLTVGGLGGDESFLVLVSDGVTNCLTDQEVADIITSHFNNRGHPAATPQLCCEEVIKFVEYVGGDDNATCMVARLNGWGKWPIIDRTGELRQSRMDDYNPRQRG